MPCGDFVHFVAYFNSFQCIKKNHVLSVCNFDVFITVKVNLPEARVSKKKKKKKNIHKIVLLFPSHVKSELT